MADETTPDLKEAPPASFTGAQREKKVTKLSARIESMERALDVALSDYEPAFNTYIAFYRVRHGCDPDTAECPADFLDQSLVEVPEE